MFVYKMRSSRLIRIWAMFHTRNATSCMGVPYCCSAEGSKTKPNQDWIKSPLPTFCLKHCMRRIRCLKLRISCNGEELLDWHGVDCSFNQQVLVEGRQPRRQRLSWLGAVVGWEKWGDLVFPNSYACEGKFPAFLAHEIVQIVNLGIVVFCLTAPPHNLGKTFNPLALGQYTWIFNYYLMYIYSCKMSFDVSHALTKVSSLQNWWLIGVWSSYISFFRPGK